MVDIRRQIQQEDLATGLSLAKAGPWEMNLAQGYAAGAGAGRALGGLFGMEDPRIVEQRAISKAVSEMDFSDPNNLFKLGQLMIERGDWERGQRMIELASQAQYYQGTVAAKGAKSGAPLKISLPELIKQHREGLIAYARKKGIDINVSQLREKEAGEIYSKLSGKVTELANVLSKLQNQGADPIDIMSSDEYNQLIIQMYDEILNISPTAAPNYNPEYSKTNPFPMGP